MSNTTAQEVVEELRFEDLECYWLQNGLPVFTANRENICDIVENLGFTMYYLLANYNKKTNVTTTHPTTKVSTSTVVESVNMQLFKVTNNAIGRVVQLASDPFDDSFIQLEEEAVYSMPPIPVVLLDKLDQFFRLVDAQHKSESIVMLTFDDTKQGSEGWGIIVPDQENNSVHCNYDPTSVAAEKPDHVTIVGSVHSHPEMPAYASGTDHADQADFDGIHITFGWQKSVNNGATQYHIEMQMQGKTYVLQPEDVFEDRFFQHAPDPEVVAWTEKVKKALPPNAGGSRTHQGQLALTGPQTQETSTATGIKTIAEKAENGLWVLQGRMMQSFGTDVGPDAIIVAQVERVPGSTSQAAGWCPNCGVYLEEFNFFTGYCDECYIPITDHTSSNEEIMVKLVYYCNDLKVSPNGPVYIWKTYEDGTDSLMKMFPNLADEIKLEVEAGRITSDMIEDHDRQTHSTKDRMICCGAIINEKRPCSCVFPLYPDDLFDFDRHLGAINIYKSGSDCTGCQHYYDIECPRYKEEVIRYSMNGSIPPEYFTERIDHVDCPSFIKYDRSNSSYYSGYSE